MGLPLIALLAVAAIALSGGNEAPQPATGGRPQDSGDGGGEKSVDLGTPSLGSADAPVVLTEYSDFQ